MSQLLRRVERIKAVTKTESSEVLSWINKGLYYDDLTDEQRTAYCRYRDFDRQAVEDIHYLMYDDTDTALHFPLEKNLPPMTREEEIQHLRTVSEEIEAYLLDSEI
jgi:hypothetical protein